LTESSEKTNENIVALGFNNVKIGNVNTFLERFRMENKEVPIQFFDSKMIAGYQHLYFGGLNALRAFKKKINISNNIAVESLLYASAQRQINKAVKMLGIKQDSSEIAVLIIARNSREKDNYVCLVSKIIPGVRDDKVLELTANKCRSIKIMFNISDLEFEAKLKKQGLEKEALIDLVIERMALLVTKS